MPNKTIFTNGMIVHNVFNVLLAKEPTMIKTIQNKYAKMAPKMLNIKVFTNDGIDFFILFSENILSFATKKSKEHLISFY